MRRLSMIGLAALVFFTAGSAAAEDVWVDDNGVALGGYDVVAYYLDGQATPGQADFAAEHNGVTYHFASANHRAIFQAAPEEFLPAYAGYCAFAVSMHSAKVPPDPATFAIQDGRLLLFFNGEFEGQQVNTLTLWDQNADEHLQTADSNWPSVAAQ